MNGNEAMKLNEVLMKSSDRSAHFS